MRTFLGQRLAVTVSILLAACSGGDSSAADRAGKGGKTSGSGAGDGPGAGAGGTSNQGDFGNGSVRRDGGIAMTRVPTMDGGECGASSIAAKQIVTEEEVVTMEEVTAPEPVALYIMLDQSASMQTSGLWAPAEVALKAFVNDPASAGIDVALQFFPATLFDACDGSGLKAPTVPIGRLPDNAAAISAALDARPVAAGLGTPIEAALRAATQYCTEFQTTNPMEKCVAVLVTDGAPSTCELNATNLANISATALTQTVTTFAVGFTGANFALLDAIAMAGGAADCSLATAGFACDISSGPSQLVDALKTIRDVVTTVTTHTETVKHVKETPLACEWEIPAPPKGEVFDRTLVNVKLTAPGTDLALGLVDSVDACAARGWYYDDPAAPKRIIACPETCDTITTTPSAKIDILLGCLTVPLE